jgi:hypothetical protein
VYSGRVPAAARLAALATCVLAAFGLASVARAGTQTLVFRSQAITVKPFQAAQSVQLVPSPSVDGYVTGMSADLVDANGNVVSPSHSMLHHVVFAKLGAPDYTCGALESVPAERFYAEGEEHYAMRLPDGYGYPNGGGDHWGLLAMLMNHHTLPQQVYVRYTVRYATGMSLRPVVPIWLDIHNCSADPIFDVPGTGGKGSTYARHVDVPIHTSGRIVTAGGHLHGGGISLALSDETCGRTLFTSLPTWGAAAPRPILHEPGPSHMSSFASPIGIPVAAGDTLRLTATYDDSVPHTRVMGIMIAYLSPGLVTGCEPIPALTIDLGNPGPPPVVRVPLLRPPRGRMHRNIRSTWVGDYTFGAQRITIRRGTTFRWRFIGAVAHDVTVASGPVGFSSPSEKSGTFVHRFTRKGVYRLFCSLHPGLMTEVIRVR